MPDVPQIHPAALPAELPEGVLLLDVREDDEWELGHAPGALHIPMTDVPSRLDEIDPEAQVYVICRSGGRSQRVAEYLAHNGYEVSNIEGGSVAWHGVGHPIVRDDGQPARVK